MSDVAIEAALARLAELQPFRVGQPPPREARCFVCLEASSEGNFLPLGCGCRGAAGWAHAACLFEMVKDAADDVVKCRTCQGSYTGPTVVQVTWKYWRRHRGKDESDPRRLYAYDLVGRVLTMDRANDGGLVVQVLRQNLRTHTRLYGRDHQNVCFALSELAKALLIAGEPDEAEKLLKPFVRRPLAANDWTHGWNGLTLAIYADLLCETDRFADAEDLVRGAVAALDRAASQDEPDGWLARNRRNCGAYQKLILVTALTMQNKDAEALRVLTKLHADLRRTFGPDHPLTAQVQDHLRTYHSSES